MGKHNHDNCHVHTWAFCGSCQVYYCTQPGCDAEEKAHYRPYPYQPWIPYTPPYQPYTPWKYPYVTWEGTGSSGDPSPIMSCGGHINR